MGSCRKGRSHKGRSRVGVYLLVRKGQFVAMDGVEGSAHGHRKEMLVRLLRLAENW